MSKPSVLGGSLSLLIVLAAPAHADVKLRLQAGVSSRLLEAVATHERWPHAVDAWFATAKSHPAVPPDEVMAWLLLALVDPALASPNDPRSVGCLAKAYSSGMSCTPAEPDSSEIEHMLDYVASCVAALPGNWDDHQVSKTIVPWLEHGGARASWDGDDDTPVVLGFISTHLLNNIKTDPADAKPIGEQILGLFGELGASNQYSPRMESKGNRRIQHLRGGSKLAVTEEEALAILDEWKFRLSEYLDDSRPFPWPRSVDEWSTSESPPAEFHGWLAHQILHPGSSSMTHPHGEIGCLLSQGANCARKPSYSKIVAIKEFISGKLNASNLPQDWWQYGIPEALQNWMDRHPPSARPHPTGAGDKDDKGTGDDDTPVVIGFTFSVLNGDAKIKTNEAEDYSTPALDALETAHGHEH